MEGTIDYVARIAAAMSKELNPKKEDKTSSATLAAWLAK
jgi:serine protease Do